MTTSTAGRRFRWAGVLHAAVGAATTVAGVVLTTRPFESLSVLVVLVAVGALVTAGTHAVELARARRRTDIGLAIGWFAVAATVLAWPSATVRAIAVVAGVAMIVAGLERIVAAVSGTTDERTVAALRGGADVVLGAVALSWPDVTVMVVAVAFGLRTTLFGVSELRTALRPRLAPRATMAIRPWRRSMHVVVAAVGLAAALLIAALSVHLHATAGDVDAFYDPPASVPSTPGALVRVERYERGVPRDAIGWRILYSTTRADGRGVTVGSAVVVVPATSTAGPHPVVAWAHGTTGVARPCAPSAQPAGLSSSSYFAVDRVLGAGWGLVAPDYPGLGTPGPHPYVIGAGEGDAVLDAVRAARQVSDAHLGADTVVWGHSQGGHAALWTGQLSTSYAPDLHVVGVAALAPAADLPGLVNNIYALSSKGVSVLAAYVIAAYAAVYPAVHFDDYVKPTAALTVREFAQRCLTDAATLVPGVEALATSADVFASRPDRGPRGDRLTENTPTGPFAMPVLIGQGASDPLILPVVQAAYAERLCASGDDVDYRTYAGRDHLSVVAPDSPLVDDVLRWTADRFAGRPSTPTCR